jgi:predicted HicB family RNase H-like nuclease
MAIKKKTEPTARVTMRLPQSLWDAVQHRAIDEHVSLSQLVTKALTAYLMRGGKA